MGTLPEDKFWKSFHSAVYNPTKAANMENGEIALKIKKQKNVYVQIHVKIVI